MLRLNWRNLANAAALLGAVIAVGALTATSACHFDPNGANGGSDGGGSDGDLADAPPGTYRLTMTVTGGGKVASAPAGIDCGRGGTSCIGDFAAGSTVVLTPSSTTVWGGDCAAGATCSLTMNADHAASATFPATADVAYSGLFASGSTDTIDAVAVAGGGDVVIGGSFNKSDFSLLANPDDYVGGKDAFVARIHADGSVAWVTTFGGTADDGVHAIAIEPSGAILIAGEIAGGNVILDNCSAGLTGSGTDSDMVFARLDQSTGACIWAIRKGSSGNDRALGITVSGDNVAVVGAFSGAVAFDNAALTSHGGSDAIVMIRSRLDGSEITQQAFGGASDDRALACAFAPNGNLFVGGGFKTLADFGDGATVAVGEDGFVLQLDLTLTLLAKRLVAGGGNDTVLAVAVAADGTLAYAGTYSSNVTIGNVLLPAGGNANAFAATVKAGVFGIVKAWNSNGDDVARAIGFGDDNNVVVAGDYKGAFDFGLGLTTPIGDKDLWAVELKPDGTLVWALVNGTTKADSFNAVGVDTSAVWLGGIIGDDVDLGTGPLIYGGGTSDGLLVRVNR